MTNVVLVDAQGRETGLGDKLEVHRSGDLHRAFSIFVFNNSGNLMLQRRAAGKYHSAGLWSNTCCSHPYPGESITAAAHRRLQQEMGFGCILQEVFNFTYRAEVGQGLTEHEYDHVFVGIYSGQPKPSQAEAQDWKWVSLPSLENDIEGNSDRYTSWFKLIMENNSSALTHGLRNLKRLSNP
ncbi:MAG: isopentenyl-diphosphate Delta-isomerase [Gammaproteobacteria bacterium]|nr:isopentenyl-diphosphate Delta-isomerase [Gammaproteobacteria bacterium]